jgi:stage 0 sporulation protein B (sporulation initiation phosphotransferase)
MMEKDWELLDLLRHSRHDWLNQIQLIKGNLSLNRMDRVHEIIENITIQSKHESKLTNLNVPDFAGLLLTFNWARHPYHLDFEVIGKECNLSLYEKDLLNFCKTLFSELDQLADNTIDHHLLLTFQLIEEEHYLTLEFSGKLKDAEAFERKISLLSRLHKSFVLVENYVNEEEFVLTLELTG